jgi:hypothetical protein
MWTHVRNQPPEWRQTPASKRWCVFQLAVMVAVAWPLYRYSWRVIGGNDDGADMLAPISVIMAADIATVALSRFLDSRFMAWARQFW